MFNVFFANSSLAAYLAYQPVFTVAAWYGEPFQTVDVFILFLFLQSPDVYCKSS